MFFSYVGGIPTANAGVGTAQNNVEEDTDEEKCALLVVKDRLCWIRPFVPLNPKSSPDSCVTECSVRGLK